MFHVKLFLIALLVPLYSQAQSYQISLEDKPIYHPLQLDTAVDRWDKSFFEYSLLNNQSKELLYWTNYSRNNFKRFWDSVIVPVLKEFPVLKGEYSNSLHTDLLKISQLPLFKPNSSLIKMSQKQSDEIGKNQLPLSHNSPDGSSFADRFNQFHLKNCGGENISLSDDVLFGLVLLYIDYNLPSVGHRVNLLSTKFTEIGIGSAKYGNTSNIFNVQDFACDQ